VSRAARSPARAPARTTSADDGPPPMAPDATPHASAANAEAGATNDTFVAESAAGDASPQATLAPPPIWVIARTRLAFGPSLYNREAYPSTGNGDQDFATWVAEQLSPNFAIDVDCNARLAAANLSTLSKSLTQLWTDHMRNPNDNPDFHRDDPANDVYLAAFIRGVYSRWQLFEVLVDFWHNHFNIYAWDYSYASTTFVHYDRDVIRANALGNFRIMLEAVAKSPAMLFYLDNYLNTNAGPNENWAREMFELHTMGAENYAGVVPRTAVPGWPTAPEKYCDGDVYESTRCFTGWRVNDEEQQGDPTFKDDGTFLYDSGRHDRFQKIVLGQQFDDTWYTIAEKDGQEVLNLVAKHPGTGRHLVRKLWRRLIGDGAPAPDSSNPFFDYLANLWTTNWQHPNQIKMVVSEMLVNAQSPFKVTFGDKIKRPFEAAISMLRAIDADFSPDDSHWDFSWFYESMGQDLFSRRPPDGYPDVKHAWNNTTSMLMRWRFCNWMIEEGVPKDRPDIRVELYAPTLTAFPVPAGRTSNAVADYWILRILGRTMTTSQSHKAVVDMLARGANPATYALSDNEVRERVPDAVALILMSPDFQLR
jgi:uncharacterized protein (DUF1800 family)